MGFKALVPSLAVTEDTDHPANVDLAVAEATTMLAPRFHEVTRSPRTCEPRARGQATG